MIVTLFNQLANKVFDLTIDGGKILLGDYQYYIEKVEEAEALESAPRRKNE